MGRRGRSNLIAAGILLVLAAVFFRPETPPPPPPPPQPVSMPSFRMPSNVRVGGGIGVEIDSRGRYSYFVENGLPQGPRAGLENATLRCRLAP